MNITIIGTGAYGLSIALALLKNKHTVTMWVESEERVSFLNNHRNDANILPNIKIPNEITFTSSYEDAINKSNIIFIAVACKYVNSVTKEIGKLNIKNKHFCLLSKGIEENTCEFVSDVFKRNIKTKNVSVISGPSFAIDLANNEPIGLSIASKNKVSINVIKKVLESNTLKLRETNDLIGVELCGSIKNVVAIAAGILDGLGFKESTRSFLITESLHDIKSLIYGLGGNKKTILSFAGVGDLLLTSTSYKSRNYTFGTIIGKNNIKESKEYLNNYTVEGYYTLKSIYKLIKKRKIDMPLINIIYKIVIKESNPNILTEFLIKKD